MEEQEVKAMLHDEMVVTLKKSIENCEAWKKIATQKRHRITEDASSKDESSEGRKESDHGDEKRHQITEDVTQKAHPEGFKQLANMEEQEVKAMLYDEMVVTLKKSIENCKAWKKIATQKRHRITEDASSEDESSEGKKEFDHGDEKRRRITEDASSEGRNRVIYTFDSFDEDKSSDDEAELKSCTVQ